MNDFSEEILLLRQRLNEAEKYLKIDESVSYTHLTLPTILLV